MTFDARETSITGGQPMEFYEFQMGLDYWRFTSGDEAVTHNGAIYVQEVISRTTIEASVDIQRGNIAISVARTNPIAELFRIGQPQEVVLLRIFKIHRSDIEAVTIWIGRVVNVTFIDDATAAISCESVHSSLKRVGLRRLYQRQCPHVVYMQGPGLCNADEESKRETVTLLSVVGTVLSAGAFATHADGYYAGGLVEWERTPGRKERRFILDHVGTEITVNYGVPGLIAGLSLDVLPGCDHTKDGPFGCGPLHANIDNYGGQPYIPIINPFGGTSVF